MQRRSPSLTGPCSTLRAALGDNGKGSPTTNPQQHLTACRKAVALVGSQHSPWFLGRGYAAPASRHCQGDPHTCQVAPRHQQPYSFPITKTTTTQNRGTGGDSAATAHPSPWHNSAWITLFSAPRAIPGPQNHWENLTSTKANAGQTRPAQPAAPAPPLCALSTPANRCLPLNPTSEPPLSHPQGCFWLAGSSRPRTQGSGSSSLTF